RRHTRSDRDWSSDVCSSDLEAAAVLPHRALLDGRNLARDRCGEPGQHSEVERDLGDREAGDTRVDRQRIGLEAAQHEPAARRPRSEERRVGKERIARWWTLL